MQETNVSLTVGIDLGDKNHEICVLNMAGDIVKQEHISNDISSLNEYFDNFRYPKKVTVALEAGTHSPWISELLELRDFNVLVGNPRKLRFIWKSDCKTDKKDALMLARVARFDPQLLHRKKTSLVNQISSYQLLKLEMSI
jgi:transposase